MPGAPRLHLARRFERLSPPRRGAVVAIGNFDGVHLGHQAVIAAARQRAQGLGGPVGVITFEPHPMEVLRPDSAPRRLTVLRQKATRLAELGVTQCCVLPFERRLLELTPERFAAEVLHERLGIAGLVAGSGFRFGHRRGGDMALLAELGRRHGFTVEAVPPLLVDGAPCSSSRIRELLGEGAVAAAHRLLGRAYEVLGVVRPGDRRGRELGFPTANLQLLDRRALLPRPGIYAVGAGLLESGGVAWHPAVASLGSNPTFGGTELRLEVHLLDGEHALYGRRLAVTFLERLRDEAFYPSIDLLIAQMERDCETARRIHATRPV